MEIAGIMRENKSMKTRNIPNLAMDEVEKNRFINGLKRYPQKGVPVYIDNEIPGPDDWEKLVAVREDNLFYMGDYVQADGGGLKEIRFDKVYLQEANEERGYGRRRRSRRKEDSKEHGRAAQEILYCRMVILSSERAGIVTKNSQL